MTYILDIRQRRQITLPSELLSKLGADQGDQLVVSIKDGRAVIEAKRQVALDALKQIQKAFAEAKVTESELQAAAAKQRQARADKIEWV